ncbi:hypothetical protein EV715DRAFT_268704, partial [Schizophyllum commune]
MSGVRSWRRQRGQGLETYEVPVGHERVGEADLPADEDDLHSEHDSIHFVTTPKVILHPTSIMEQEFEPISYIKLRFTLTLKIRRKPHITAQFKALGPPKPATPPPPPPIVLAYHFARYLKSDGTMAHAFISYKEIASHCDTRLFSTAYPLITLWGAMQGKISVNGIDAGKVELTDLRRWNPLLGTQRFWAVPRVPVDIIAEREGVEV